MVNFKEELENFEFITTVEEVGEAVEKEQEKNDLISIINVIKEKIKE